jgi:hypothetical protein
MLGYSWDDDEQQTDSLTSVKTGATTNTSPLSPTGQTGLAPSYLSGRGTQIGGSGTLGGSLETTAPPAPVQNQQAPSPYDSTGITDAYGMPKGDATAPATTVDKTAATSLSSAATVQGQQATGDEAMRPLLDAQQRLAASTDPTERAMLQDQIARSLYSTLQEGGHQVKWQGDQLIVDGRPYVIAGATTATAGATATTDPTAGQTPDAGTPSLAMSSSLDGIGTAAPAEASAPLAATGTAVAGATVDPNVALNQVQQAFVSRFNRPMNQAEIDALVRLVNPSGGPITADMVTAAQDYIARYTGNLQDPWGAGSPTPNPTPLEPIPGTPQWQSSWEGYQPGEVTMDDLGGLDAQTVLNGLGGPVDPTGGQTGAMTEDAVQRLLADPYGLNDRTVEMLKARSKDELAEMGASEQDMLRNFGWETGVADSNWIRSEQLAANRERDRAIVGGNRDIDILAAQSRKGDERAAAELGAKFTNDKFTRALGSKQEQRQAMQLATDTGLRSAAIRGDRMALREQIAAKAAELGMDADRLTLQYTLGLMQDLTTRYGIDVDKDLDLRKLASADRQFNEELAFKFAQLQFQYDELSKRDDWAQLNAGVTLAGYTRPGQQPEGWDDERFGDFPG